MIELKTHYKTKIAASVLRVNNEGIAKHTCRRLLAVEVWAWHNLFKLAIAEGARSFCSVVLSDKISSNRVVDHASACVRPQMFMSNYQVWLHALQGGLR